MMLDVDNLSNMIREIDGSHKLGAGALAEALLPKIINALSQGPEAEVIDDGTPERGVKCIT